MRCFTRRTAALEGESASGGATAGNPVLSADELNQTVAGGSSSRKLGFLNPDDSESCKAVSWISGPFLAGRRLKPGVLALGGKLWIS